MNTSILRYAKVLDEMFDAIDPSTATTSVVPLHQDQHGTDAFLQFYWWATRDKQFFITEENLAKLLQFVDKFDVPLLAQEIISWTKSQDYRMNPKFAIKMIFHCLGYSFLTKDRSYWYRAVVGYHERHRVLEMLRSPELAEEVANRAVLTLILALVHVLEISRLSHLDLDNCSDEDLCCLHCHDTKFLDTSDFQEEHNFCQENWE